MQPTRHIPLSSEDLRAAISLQSKEMERAYRWLEQHMPPSFFEEIGEHGFLIARNLLSFQLQDRYSSIHLKYMAIVLCLDGPDADLKILKAYAGYAIRYYRAFVSDAPPPRESTGALRIAILYLRDEPKGEHGHLEPERRKEIVQRIKERNNEFGERDLEMLLQSMASRFVRSLKTERLALALDMSYRAMMRDECQYEVLKNEDWRQTNAPSLQIVLAWRQVPKAGFLYRLAKIIRNHGLGLHRVVATYVNPYSVENILILSIGLHGLQGGAAWEEADIDDFLRELVLLKYFETEDGVAETFVKSKLLTGNEAHLVRTMASFVHQALLYVDPYLYSLDNVIEGFCRHPELSVQLCKLFEAKFHPQKQDAEAYQTLHPEILDRIGELDTGQALNDLRRKNILKQSVYFIEYALKTNFYRQNKTGFSFRLDPAYLDCVPHERKEKFPELPYGIFFIRGMHFIGFNIRFKDLARGGVRTVMPDRWESYFQERNNIFAEAYNLAYTQQKKNKDIPEGGAKTAILLAPYDVFFKEEAIFVQEMELEGMNGAIIQEKLKISRRNHKLSYLYASQRAFIECFMTLLNCDEQGVLEADDVVDYWKRPEYIYLGPDENMLNDMIVWIANFAVQNNYQPGRSFMSSKPGAGINHKEYGVTSYGVNVYLHQTLLALGIDPAKQSFTVKISGGPDGDVAGNEMHILANQYANTAKLLAITDVSGTIFDPEGLDWAEIDALFKAGQAIRFYPSEKLHEGGFLLDLQTKREESAYVQQTLCWRKQKGRAVQEWLSGNEMNHLFRSNVHQVPTDVFITGGGRPRTLNETNVKSYLDATGKPTSRAIVEGANLYLTPGARRFLENLGVLILKDSSCNKGGVICSSFEVLASLCLSEEEFIKEKPTYVKQVLERIREAAENEANLILETHKRTHGFCTDLSDQISERINRFKYQLLDHLEPMELSEDPNDPLIRCLFLYCPALLRERYPERILKIPDIHKKAVIAVYLASHLVYTRGLEWNPTVAEILEAL